MSSGPKVIVISGADDGYAHFAKDLFASIKAQKYKCAFDLGLLDIGLNAENRAWFAAQGARIEKAQADIDYPAREVWEREKPGCRTFTAKPFLRRYFPAYDVYVWLDADAWVQTPEAIDTMIESATGSNAIHIAMEFDRGYTSFFEKPSAWNAYHEWYAACFHDDNVTAHMTLKPMLNVGAFAMTAGSPVWDAWLKIYADALQRTPEMNAKTVMMEQLAMNVAIYMMNLPRVILPAGYNWLTFFGTPMLDKKTGFYVEPLAPHRPISIFHLTQKPKDRIEKIPCSDGDFVERSLLYSARK